MSIDCSRCHGTAPDESAFCNHCGAAIAHGAPLARDLGRPAGVTALAIMNGLVGLVLLVAAPLLAARAGEERLFFVLAILALAGAVAHLACAVGLWRMRNWGRLLQLGLAVIGLLGVPIGTLLAVAVIAYLVHPGSEALFARRPDGDFTAEERAAIVRIAHSSTMVVIFVVGVTSLAILGGLLGVVALPRLVDRLEMRRVARSMANLRTIGLAIESYAVQNNRYPSSDSLGALVPLLEPTYARHVPRLDGWSRPLKVETWWNEDANPPAGDYIVGSAGRDGQWEEGRLSDYAGYETTSFDADIIFRSGEFIELPKSETPDAAPSR